MLELLDCDVIELELELCDCELLDATEEELGMSVDVVLELAKDEKLDTLKMLLLCDVFKEELCTVANEEFEDVDKEDDVAKESLTPVPLLQPAKKINSVVIRPK